MGKVGIILSVLMIYMITTSFNPGKNKSIAEECDVAEFYEAIEPAHGVKVLSTLGELEEVDLILVPTEIEEGIYEVSLTRKGSNLYKLEGTDYYAETRYCYEYVYYEEAILKVESNFGYTIGTLYFE